MTPKPVRVLHLMPDAGVGGAERALLVIAQQAAPAGIELEVAFVGPPRRPVPETVLPDLDALGVPVHQLGATARPVRSPLALVHAARRLRRIVRERRVEVVDSCLFDADLTARLALLGSPVTHVVHLVNTPYDPAVARRSRGRGAWRRRATRAIDAGTAHLTESFVAVTAAVAARASQDLRLRPDHLTVIERGVDLEAFAAAPPRPGIVGPSRPLRILHVGRLVPQKGQRTLIGAVAELTNRGVPVELTILGEGPLLEELSAHAAAEGVEDRVALAGVVHDVRPALEACDVFAFPSLWEGQGNALLEAMALARPVVASDLAVFREVTGDDGVLCRPGDVGALATALEEVAGWSNERRAAVGAALRRRVEQRYAAPVKVRALGDHYRSLLAP